MVVLVEGGGWSRTKGALLRINKRHDIKFSWCQKHLWYTEINQSCRLGYWKEINGRQLPDIAVQTSWYDTWIKKGQLMMQISRWIMKPWMYLIAYPVRKTSLLFLKDTRNENYCSCPCSDLHYGMDLTDIRQYWPHSVAQWILVCSYRMLQPNRCYKYHHLHKWGWHNNQFSQRSYCQ